MNFIALSLCSYDVFIMRILLAALDHNVHLFRAVLEGPEQKTYSERSKNWRVKPVKAPEKYPNWTVMAAKTLKRRASDTQTIVRLKQFCQVTQRDWQPLLLRVLMRPLAQQN